MSKQLVQLKVDSDRLNEWDSFVDEANKVDNRSRLIRVAVEEYISNSGDSGGINDADVDRILTRIGEVETELNEHNDRLLAHRQETVNYEEFEAMIERLSRDIIGELEERIDSILIEEIDFDQEILAEEIAEEVAMEVDGGAEYDRR